MSSRLIISISAKGQFKVLLQGQGEPRLKLLKVYERKIEGEIPALQQKILEAVNENTDSDLN